MTTTQHDLEPQQRWMRGLFRAIAAIERVGNLLPHPFWLFWILTAILGVTSLILSVNGASAVLPDSGDRVVVQNLLSLEGLAFAVDSAFDNFAGFPALAIVVVMLLGVSVAERSGLLEALLRLTVVRLPARWVTFAIAFTAMLAHVMSDSVYLVMIPLGALAFRAAGRSPVLGIMVAYVSASAGFNASPVVTPSDAIRSALSTAAAQLVDPEYLVTPIATYFFSAVSSVVLAVTITLVVELVLARRPEFATPTGPQPDRVTVHLGTEERRGLLYAGLSAVIFVGLVITLSLVPGSPLAGEGEVVESPLIANVGVYISLLFALTGIVYGLVAGTFRAFSDVPKAMGEGIATLAPVIVLFFAASQFLAYFAWTGVGSLLTVGGADLLHTLEVPHVVVLLIIVLAVSLINMIVTSGSAMWAIFAPVLVPMLMYYGMTPEAAQVAFMIGDSTTNAVTPMSPYFVLALGFVQQHRKDAGIGTLASFTIPVAFAMLIAWTVLLVIWFALGIPVGPGVTLT